MIRPRAAGLAVRLAGDDSHSADDDERDPEHDNEQCHDCTGPSHDELSDVRQPPDGASAGERPHRRNGEDRGEEDEVEDEEKHDPDGQLLPGRRKGCHDRKVGQCGRQFGSGERRAGERRHPGHAVLRRREGGLDASSPAPEQPGHRNDDQPHSDLSEMQVALARARHEAAKLLSERERSHACGHVDREETSRKPRTDRTARGPVARYSAGTIVVGFSPSMSAIETTRTTRSITVRAGSPSSAWCCPSSPGSYARTTVAPQIPHRGPLLGVGHDAVTTDFRRAVSDLETALAAWCP